METMENSTGIQTQPTMTAAPPTVPHLRVWPAVLCLIALAVTRLIGNVMGEMSPTLFMVMFFGPLVVYGLTILWWLFVSRANWVDRFVTLLVLGATAVAANKLAHYSVRDMVFQFYMLPVAIGGFLIAVIALSWFDRRMAAWGATLLACACFAVWPLLRNEGFTGDFQSSFHWRWTPTDEELYLARQKAERESVPADVAKPRELGSVKWAGFRGVNRDGVVSGVRLDEDWKAHPPKEVWRRSIGPGWSSFAVAGDLLFTQEQAGELESVLCYDAGTGKEVWHYEYPSKFWEAVAGVGPRATPTLADGALYTLGAQGILCRLDPLTGKAVWTRDVKADSARDKPPMWGFSSSPLVTHGLVIVHAGGTGDKGLFAYDVQTGEPRWGAPSGDHSYSSPQLSTVAGQECVLMVTNMGVSAHEPATGKTLWNHEWKYEGYRVVQPMVVSKTSVLLGTGVGAGTRRVDVTADGTTTGAWTSQAMKPGFNDFVALNGNLYGVDNNILACIDLETGAKKWKDGRYGNGELLVLPDAGQLLVLTEKGDLVLLRANPERREELGRVPVLQGKTWNHPVLVGNRVFVRNGVEAACFELATR